MTLRSFEIKNVTGSNAPFLSLWGG